MKTAPIILDNCYFTEVKILAQANAEAANGMNGFEIIPSINVTSPDPANPRSIYVFVSVKIEPKDGNVPFYVGSVEAMAGFTIDARWPEDKIEQLAFVNGGGIIYGAIREMVCLITARGFFRMLNLPTLSFYEMFKELEQRRKQEAENQVNLNLEPTPPASTPAGSSNEPQPQPVQ